MNLGYSGDTTGNVLWRIENGELDGIRPKAAVILIGTNDSAHGATAEQASAGIDEIVRLVHAKCPSTRVLLLGILPSRVTPKKSEIDEAVNAYLAKRYAMHPFVTYIDVGEIFLKNGELDESLFYDPRLTPPRGPLHPDTRSRRKMAEALEPSLERILS